jgi:hypothetical protein
MGHLNMQSLKAQHSHNTVSVHVMPSSVNDLSYESCNLNKAASAPQNRKASQKPAAPLQHMLCVQWGPVSVPSPYGLRYCLVVIDHHANFMRVRFLKSKDETCAKLETILLDVRHTHARFHSHLHAFAPFLKFDSDSVFEAANTQLMCTRLGFSTRRLTRITCWGRQNACGALCVTTRPQCFTQCMCLTACGHARSALWSTSVTVLTVAMLVHLEGSLSPFLRAQFRTRISSVWVCGICQSA